MVTSHSTLQQICRSGLCPFSVPRYTLVYRDLGHKFLKFFGLNLRFKLPEIRDSPSKGTARRISESGGVADNKCRQREKLVTDWAFRAFTAGLGVTTIYLTATFSFNVYRGLAWHNDQKKAGKEGILQKTEERSATQNTEGS